MLKLQYDCPYLLRDRTQATIHYPGREVAYGWEGSKRVLYEIGPLCVYMNRASCHKLINV